ncbi:hypothetical protein NIIDMKKI_58980 [Mycobacterium kansasii]|uniref:Nucleotidyl transferase domain-containing protein n=1 Tax=Mycobacterium kansasii TaxID=1768 RepID=A0A7G1IL23_MYCKA|nr:hypothetical protein NIIDMKKI_58980 [Mycobacterium kansasii]
MAVRQVDAVILVGGKGTRLRPLTLSAPKPMLPTAGLPFLTHLLSRIAAAGIEHVILSTSYRAEVFEAEFGDGSKLGLQIDYVTEENPLGTGGGIANVADKLRYDTVMVFNGDVLSGADLNQLLEFHDTNQADVTLHLVRVGDPRAFGCVPTDADGRVTAFLEKTEDPPTDQINAGCYVFKREIIDRIPGAARSRWNARSFRRCSPTPTSGFAAMSTPHTGATWGHRKISCAGPLTWFAVSLPHRPCTAIAVSSWCTTARRSRPGRC